MRPEVLYLVDIIDAAAAISRFLASTSRDAFLGDELRQSAILQKLIVIGEASARLPDAYKMEHPEVPWRDVAAFRNFAVHEYFAVSWAIVWATATEDVPRLQTQVTELLADLGYVKPDA